MKKVKLFGVLIMALVFSVVSVKALDVTSDFKLTEDVTEALVVPEGKTVTIDLNGHNITVTGAGVDAISNHGILTIKGSGEVTAKEGAAVVNYPGGVTTLDNGEYLSTGWYTIKNMGTMTINNLKFGNNVNNGSSLIANGYYGSLGNDRNQEEADTVMMPINGGTFENKNNSCNVIKNDDYGKLVINGGTFIAGSDSETNANPVVQNWHIATINDGTFTSKNGVVLTNGHWSDTVGIGVMTVNGGTFTGKTGIFGQNGGATQGKGTLTIKGGVFNGPAILSTVYETAIEDGIFDDDSVAPAEDSGYTAVEVLFGDDEGKVVIIADDEELEEEPYYDRMDKEEIETEVEQILDAYEKYKNGELDEDEYDEDDIEELEVLKKFIDELKKYNVIDYYNIMLTGVTSDGYAVDVYNEVEEPVTLELDAPELPEVKEGFTRKYYVIRLHDGEITVIDNVTVDKNGKAKFESDKFSVYVLAYNDVEDEKEKTTTESENKEETATETKVEEPPKTFDSVVTYIILVVVAAILVTYTSLYLRKRFNH